MGQVGHAELRLRSSDSVVRYGQQMGEVRLSNLGLESDYAVGFRHYVGEVGGGSMAETGRCCVQGVEGGRSPQSGY